MSHKILVIEDDTDIQELIREFLMVQHYDVDTANDGDEGIRKFMENRPDLLILDIMLPKQDGYQVLESIRQISSVPVIMLTALDEEADQIKGFELGVDDYITKPFSFHILNKRVEAVLRRTPIEISDGYTQLITMCVARKSYIDIRKLRTNLCIPMGRIV